MLSIKYLKVVSITFIQYISSTRGSLLGAEHFFKKYVGDLEKEEPCCPLCHREFDTDQEVRELVLEVHVQKIPCLV